MARKVVHCYLSKKDLKSGMVQKRAFQNTTEYLVYRHRKSNILDALGQKLDSEEVYLYCMILSDGKIVKENKEAIYVNGIKLETQEEINTYLRGTGR